MEKKGCCILDTDAYRALTTSDLELAQCMLKGRLPAHDPHNLSPEVSRQLEDLVVADARSCSCCSVKFPNATAQRAHFKLDWHRYNIKRQLIGLSSVSEEAFSAIADKGDDIESISGSESESEEDEVEKRENAEQGPNFNGKVFYKTGHGQIISIYRCVLFPAKECNEDTPPIEFVKRAYQLIGENQWAVFMLGGGHFAAGIFNGQEAVVHKTFHCYTVRAKQGGSQSTRDNKGGSHPKSAGASLRRYNEQALIQHVQDLISAWADHLKSCSLIFVRAVGPTNRSVLFGGKIPPLDKTDPRIRNVPFPTRRATYSEVQRVFGMLSFVEEHGPEAKFMENYPSSPERKPLATKDTAKTQSDTVTETGGSPRRSKNKGGVKPNRAKSRPSPQRSLPASLSCTASEAESCTSDMEMTYVDQEVKFSDKLENLDQAFKNEVKKSKKEKSKGQKPVNPTPPQDNRSKEEKLKEEKLKAQEAEKKQRLLEKKLKKEAASELRKQELESRKQEQEAALAANPLFVFQKELEAALESQDLERLKNCLSSNFLQTLPSPLPGGLKETLSLPFPGSRGNTALHIASRAGEPLFISELMAVGADPSSLNKKRQTPYVVALNDDTKKAFQDFLVQNPEKFDYSQSQIPAPLSEEEERAKAEKIAAFKKAKKDAEKEKRRKKAENKAEQEERARFLALTDREKRALAAERRILAAQKRGTTEEGKSKPIVLARCFLCAMDVSGQVTFDYEQYRFCTIECLRAHRKQTNPENKINRL